MSVITLDNENSSQVMPQSGLTNTEFTKKSIAILGAGSWGTAVALHLAHNGHEVVLWSNDSKQVAAINLNRINQKYLPDNLFPDNLRVSNNLDLCVQTAQYVIIAVPSHAFASIIHKMPKPKNGISWLTKGVDPSSEKFLSQIVTEKWGDSIEMAMITGPSFAKEVAKQLPTTLVIASNCINYSQQLRNIIHHSNMRVYLSDDLLGVQCCGAIKNILAIACGISDGLGYGSNAKAALITRGLNEMRSFGLYFGAHPHTFTGLAGVGDLVLTCTDNQSRNRRLGLLLGAGVEINLAQEQIGQVVEGIFNSKQIYNIATKNQIYMPISEIVHKILNQEISPSQAVDSLLKRPPRNSEYNSY